MERNFDEAERYRRAQKRVKEIKGFYWHLFWYLVVNIFLSFGGPIRDLLRGEGFDFDDFHIGNLSLWFFWGIGVVGHWLHVFGTSIIFSKNWEERKIKEYMDNEKDFKG